MSSKREMQQNLKFLKIQNFTLQKIGINMDTLKGKELLQSHGKFLFLLACVIYVQFGLINYVAHSGITNLDMASGSLSLFNQGCLVLIKLITFLLRGDKFLQLIWHINRLAEKANPVENKKWHLENSRGDLIGKIYFYTCWVVVVCSGIFPLILMAYDYKKGNNFKHTLPFGGKFPYEENSLNLFILNYILSMLYIYGLLNMTVSIDALYGWFIHSISAHFRILRCKLESLALKLEKNYCSNFSQQLGSIVNYHNSTLKFVKDLNDIFGEILWAEVMFSSLQMCFAIFTLLNDNNTFNMPLNLTVLLAGFMQVTIYCFGGEKIKNESLMLSSDFYLMFPWHKMSPKEKKLMILPLKRSQKLSVLRGLFFEVDRNLLVYVLKTAFSFNALMSAMKE